MKRTKHKLFSSIATLLVCFAMLIGSTYAWFTDTASTGVNKIQAGNLDIQLLDESGNSIEGSTLNWAKPTGVSEDVLWEPGVTYFTQGFQIKNAGNLALKFKITINGVSGDAELLDVIDFYLTSDKSKTLEATSAVSAFDSEYHLAAGEFWKVNSNATSNVVYLAGHMKEEAGNSYQGLSLDNIGITLAATQDTVESDSFDSNYDERSVYPVVPNLNNYSVKGNVTVSDGGSLGSNDAPAKIVIPSNAVSTDTTANFSMKLTDTQPESVTYEISLKEVINGAVGDSITLSQPATVTADIGRDLIDVKVIHSENPMIEDDGNHTGEDGYYSYDRNTGVVTIWTKSFSPFKFTYKFDGVASLNGDLYPSINTAINAANDGDTIYLLKDIESDSPFVVMTNGKAVNLDLGGHKLNYLGEDFSIALGNGSSLHVSNGTVLMNYDPYFGIYAQSSRISMQNVNVYSTDAGIFTTGSNSSASLKDCYIESVYSAVYHNGSYAPASITIDNSVLVTNSVDDDPCVYISNSSGREFQTLVITNSTITGPTAVEVKHTNATVTNTRLIANTLPLASEEYGNGSCTSGYSFAVTSNSSNDEVTGNINISDCELINTQNENNNQGYFFVYKVKDGYTVNINGESISDYDSYGQENADVNSISTTITRETADSKQSFSLNGIDFIFEVTDTSSFSDNANDMTFSLQELSEENEETWVVTFDDNSKRYYQINFTGLKETGDAGWPNLYIKQAKDVTYSGTTYDWSAFGSGVQITGFEGTYFLVGAIHLSSANA